MMPRHLASERYRTVFALVGRTCGKYLRATFGQRIRGCRRARQTFQEHEAGHYELLFWLDAPGRRMYLAGISGVTVG